MNTEQLIAFSVWGAMQLPILLGWTLELKKYRNWVVSLTALIPYLGGFFVLSIMFGGFGFQASAPFWGTLGFFMLVIGGRVMVDLSMAGISVNHRLAKGRLIAAWVLSLIAFGVFLLSARLPFTPAFIDLEVSDTIQLGFWIICQLPWLVIVGIKALSTYVRNDRQGGIRAIILWILGVGCFLTAIFQQSYFFLGISSWICLVAWAWSALYALEEPLLPFRFARKFNDQQNYLVLYALFVSYCFTLAGLLYLPLALGI